MRLPTLPVIVSQKQEIVNRNRNKGTDTGNDELERHAEPMYRSRSRYPYLNHRLYRVPVLVISLKIIFLSQTEPVNVTGTLTAPRCCLLVAELETIVAHLLTAKTSIVRCCRWDFSARDRKNTALYEMNGFPFLSFSKRPASWSIGARLWYAFLDPVPVSESSRIPVMQLCCLESKANVRSHEKQRSVEKHEYLGFIGTS